MNGGALHRLANSASAAPANYDIGRSSSGIYGNNSSSSSSDYADWQPQMRKVNSSGYLNSIFKQQQQQLNQPLDSFSSNNNTSSVTKQQRSYNTSGRPVKQQPLDSVIGQKQASLLKQQQVVAGAPAYRSYDSSNGWLRSPSLNAIPICL